MQTLTPDPLSCGELYDVDDQPSTQIDWGSTDFLEKFPLVASPPGTRGGGFFKFAKSPRILQ